MAKIDKIFVGGILVVVILGIIFSFIGGATSFESQTDTFTVLTEGVNLTLSQTTGQALTSVVNSTGTAVPATNYTDYITEGFLLVIDNETAPVSMDVTYTYKQAGYLDNATVRVLLLLIPILLAIALIVKYGGKGGK